MKRQYSSDFQPPAPMIGLVVRVPGGPETRHVDGKIDSGADICALPDHVIGDLDLAPVRTVRAAGFAGVLQEVTLFHAELEVDDQRFPHVEVLSTRRPYAIIGRNVLQEFVTRLDGPMSTVTLNVPKARRPRRKPAGRRG